MDMQSIKSGSGKVVSVALAVAMGTMGVAPVALASTPNPAGGGVSAQSAKALEAGDAFDFQYGEYGNLKYKVNEGGNTVTCLGLPKSSNGDESHEGDDEDDIPENVIVPREVLDNAGNKYKVTAIACDTDVAKPLAGGSTCTIPETVTSFENGALEGYTRKYYFLGGMPAASSEYSSFGDIFPDGNDQPEAIFALKGFMGTKNAKGESWQDIQDKYIEDKAGLKIENFTAPTSMLFEYDTEEMDIGDTKTLKPKNVVDSGLVSTLPVHETIVSWSSSDTGVATVNNGKVTAVAEGTATITATNAIGASASCTVTVGSGSASGGDNPGTTDPGDSDKIDINSNCYVEGLSENAKIPLADVANLKSKIGVWYPGEMATLEVDKDFIVSFADGNKKEMTGNPASVGDYYLIVKGIGEYTGKVEIPFKVIQEAPKINIVEYEDITWEGLKGTDATIPDHHSFAV